MFIRFIKPNNHEIFNLGILFFIFAMSVFTVADMAAISLNQEYVKGVNVNEPIILTYNSHRPDIPFGKLLARNVNAQQVLGVSEENISPDNISDFPEQTKYRREKTDYTVGILGDSMIDTAGPGYPALEEKLKTLMPGVRFNILNYGVGASDIVFGLHRLTNDYVYMDNKITALLSRHPDLIVIESFAYNHWSPSLEDMNKQWLTLIKMVDLIKQQSSARILFLSTVAPNSAFYAKGIKDINWTDQERYEQSETTKKYLENHLNFARSAKIDFIDAYSKSLNSNGDGNLQYINASDYLHPSNEGHGLIAALLSDWIYKNLN